MYTERQVPATKWLSAFKGCVNVTAGVLTTKLNHGANTLHGTTGHACLLSICVKHYRVLQSA